MQWSVWELKKRASVRLIPNATNARLSHETLLRNSARQNEAVVRSGSLAGPTRSIPAPALQHGVHGVVHVELR